MILPRFFKNLGPISLKKIKTNISCETINLKASQEFLNLVGIDNQEDNTLTFIVDGDTNLKKIPKNRTIICSKKISKQLSESQKKIIVPNVHFAVAKLSNIFFREFNNEDISSFKKAIIGNNSNISNKANLLEGVVIGDNVTIREGAVINYNCVIGNNCYIDANSVISNSVIGDNVSIGRNVSIGQPGFGFAINENQHERIFHTGSVIIHSNASIGSSCTIDRGSFSNTSIGKNTYLDNLCHIAHNVKIGNNSIFAAMVGIAGSAKVGDNVMAGGQVGIAGHITIGNNVKIAAKSGVFKDIENDQSVMGNPAISQFKYIKNYKKTYG